MPVAPPTTTSQLEKELIELAKATQTQPIFERMKKKFFSVGKGMVTTALNILDKLNYANYAIGGLLAGYGIKEGIKNKITISTALFGEKYLADGIGAQGLGKVILKVAEFFTRLGTDIFLDPVNWFLATVGAPLKTVVIGNQKLLVAKNATDIAADFAFNAMIKSLKKNAPALYNQLDDLIRGTAKIATKVNKILIAALEEDPALFQKLSKIYALNYDEAVKAVNQLAKGIMEGKQGYKMTKMILTELGVKNVSDDLVREVMKRGIPELKSRVVLGIEMPITGHFQRALVRSDQVSALLKKMAAGGKELLKKIPGGNAVLENAQEGMNIIGRFLRSIGFGRVRWIYDPDIQAAISKARARIVNDIIFIDDVQFAQFNALLKEYQKKVGVLTKKYTLEQLEELGKKFFLWDALQYGADPQALKLPQKLLDQFPALKVATKTEGKRLAKAIWDSFPPEFKETIVTWRKISSMLAAEEMKRGLYDIQAKIYVPLVYRNKEKAIAYFSKYFQPDIRATFQYGKHRTIPNPLLLPLEVQNELKPVWNIFEIIPARLKASATVSALQDFALEIAEKYGKYLPEKELKNLAPFMNDGFVNLTDVINIIPQEFYQKIPSNIYSELKKLSNIKNLSKYSDKLKKIANEIELMATQKLKEVPQEIKQLVQYFRTLSDEDLLKTLKTQFAKSTWGADEIYKFRELIRTKNLFIPINLNEKLLSDLGIDLAEILKKVPYFSVSDLKFLKTYIPKELATKFAQLPQTIIPKWVAEDIITYFGKIKGIEEIEEFLKATNKLLGAFKFSVTVPFPGFHSRNFSSNIYKTFIEAGWSVTNPEIYQDYIALLAGKKKFVVSDIGEIITREQFLKELRPVRSVWLTMLETELKENTIIETMKKLPVLGHYLRFMEKVSSFIENNSRGILYFALRKKGFDPNFALSRVNWALVDYNTLTKAEKALITKIFPFWKWYKQNISTELTNLILKPGRYSQIADILDNLQQAFAPYEVVEEERKFLPVFVKNTANMLVYNKGDISYFLWSLDIPLEQAIKMTFSEPVKGWLSMLSPWFKLPLELQLDKNFFTERKISEDTNGEFAKYYPAFLKNWLEYSEVKRKDKLGREYTVYYVNPRKKYVLQTIGPMMGAGRIFTTSFVRDADALYKILTGKATFDDKIQFLHFLTGALIYKLDRRTDFERRLRELYEEYGEYLRRKGYVKTFKRYYDEGEKRIIEEYGY